MEDSSYYLQEQLLQSLEHLVDFMLRRQHPDGTITLGSTNYNSPPDTGFVVVGLAQAYQWIEKQEWDKKAKLSSGVRQFLERTIPAMLTGGCHTPNHRWVMTAALASLHDIFGLSELVARAEEWLAEGLDCTEDGEWTERSNGIYNTVNDIMLYRTAELLDKPELLEPGPQKFADDGLYDPSVRGSRDGLFRASGLRTGNRPGPVFFDLPVDGRA